MQPNLEKNKRPVTEIGITGNGRTLVSHSHGEIPNYRQHELRSRDPPLSGVKINNDRKN